MHGESSDAIANHDRDHDHRGKFTRGNNARKAKADRIAAEFARLSAEYFPNGGASTMALVRLSLVAKHLDDAKTCREAYMRQRATRCAEYLLQKVELPPKPAPSPKPVPSLQEFNL